MVILLIFILIVLAFVARLIYDIQRSKRKRNSKSHPIKNKRKSIFPESMEYSDEYFKRSFKNEVSENDQRLGIEFTKPKRKYNKKSKK